jgi:hypothetical protein
MTVSILKAKCKVGLSLQFQLHSQLLYYHSLRLHLGKKAGKTITDTNKGYAFSKVEIDTQAQLLNKISWWLTNWICNITRTALRMSLQSATINSGYRNMVTPAIPPQNI